MAEVSNIKIFHVAPIIIIFQFIRSKLLSDTGVLNYTTRTPIGVVGLICPWNLPLYLLTFKLAPALVCGNTVVCKPSELTSVTAYMLCKLVKDVGQ